MTTPSIPDITIINQIVFEAYTAFASGRINARSIIQNTVNSLENYYSELRTNCTLYQEMQAKLADYKDYLDNYINYVTSQLGLDIESIPMILDESTSPILQEICDECLCYDNNDSIRVKYETYLEELRAIRSSVSSDIDFIAQFVNDAVAIRDYIDEELSIVQGYLNSLSNVITSDDAAISPIGFIISLIQR